MDNRYYKHAGDFNLAGTLLSLVAGIAAGSIMAAVYAYAILYVPLMILRGLAPFGFGIGLGKLMGYALKKSNVRNNYVAIGIVTVVVLIAHYFAWTVWVYLLARIDNVDISIFIIGLPHVLIAIVLRINEAGAWSYRNMTPTGTYLFLIWLVEAVVIIGGAIFSAVKDVSDPFCETCQQWCEKEPCIAEFDLGDNAELKRRMEEKDFEYLRQLNPRIRGTNQWYQLDIFNCKKCDQLNTLLVSIVTRTETENSIKDSYKPIVNNLLITPTEAVSLRRIYGEIWSPAAASEPPQQI